MIKYRKLRLKALKSVARRFKMRVYSFNHRNISWMLAVKGNTLLLTLAKEQDCIDVDDIRKLGSEKDYELFAALTGLGTKNRSDYHLIAKGGFVSIMNKYKTPTLARTSRHVYSTRWWQIVLEYAKFIRRSLKSLPCIQISENIHNGTMMVSVNYSWMGALYIFVAGIPVDYAYPFNEDCDYEIHKPHRPLLMNSSIIPWLYRMNKTIVQPLPTPPPTLDQLLDSDS